MAKNIDIGGRLHSVATEHVVTGADEVLYEPTGETPKKQSEVNVEVDTKLTELENTVDALEHQDIIPVDTLPSAATADPKKIYRLTGSTSYTDYMVNVEGTDWKELATFEFPGIDNEPTAGSDDLVKSSGIYKYGQNLTYNIDFTENIGFVNASGNIDTGNNYRYTSLIPLQKGITYKINACGSSSISILSLWTKEGIYKSTLILGDGTTKVHTYTPSIDVYIRISTNNTIQPISILCNKSNLDRFSDFEDKLRTTYFAPNNGYIEPDGDIVPATEGTYKYSDLILLKANIHYVIHATGGSSIAILSQYTNEGGYLKNLITGNGTTAEYDYIPDTDIYVRFCSQLVASRCLIPFIETVDNVDSKISDVTESFDNKTISLQPQTKLNYPEYYQNGYYDTSGTFVSSSNYKTYKYFIPKNTNVVIRNVFATSSVSLVSKFDNTYENFNEMLIQGGKTFRDYSLNAKDDTYIIISSALLPVVLLKSNDGIIHETVDNWLSGYFIQNDFNIVSFEQYKISECVVLFKGDTLVLKNLFINASVSNLTLFVDNVPVQDLTKNVKRTSPYVDDFIYTCQGIYEIVRICHNFNVQASFSAYIIRHSFIEQNNAYDILQGKKFNVIGDSYLAGQGIGIYNTWAGLIARQHDMIYRNYASGGKESAWVIEHIPDMDNDADYICCICGRNDYNAQIDLTTFRTNMETICDMLIAKYLGKKIFLSTPWRRANDVGSQGLALQDYVDIIVDVCAKKSVPCYDASRNSGVFVDSAAFRALYMMGADDPSHLNEEGMKYVKPKFEAFMKSL